MDVIEYGLKYRSSLNVYDYELGVRIFIISLMYILIVG